MGKYPTKACICALLSVWLFVSVCVLIHTGLIYLRPYIKVARLQTALCRVESYFYTIQYVCKCGYSCRSSYQCLMVHVSLWNITRSGGEEVVVVPLYNDDRQQASVQNAAEETREECSYQVCNESSDDNRAAIHTFRQHYGIKDTYFPCLFDPQDQQSGALIHIVSSSHAVYHAVFWPCLAIILGLMLCVVFCKRCRQIEESKEFARMAEAKAMAECPQLFIRNNLKRNDLKFHKKKQRSLRSLWV